MSIITTRPTSPEVAMTPAPTAPPRPLPTPNAPVRVPAWWASLAFALAWASLLFVTALWLANGGVAAVATLGDAVTSLGRLSGLWSADLLLLQVFLMARIPFVERAIGQDQLAIWHRVVGFSSFTLLLVHIVAISIGYADAALGGAWSMFLDIVLEESAMVLALLGTIALCLVVGTSVRAARRALRYESWHLLHLYAYLGCFLALPHQLWTGADFLASWAATIYWWTLWALAAASVLAFRVGLPVLRNRRHRLVVAGVSTGAGGVTTVRVEGRDLPRLPVLAGQFFQWRFLDGAGWTRAHPYSLSAAPDGRVLELSAVAVGDGSARLAGLRPGTRVLIEGPYGRLHEGVRTRPRVLLLAGGIGIAPMKALLESLSGAASDIALVYRVSAMEEAPLLTEVADLAAARGISVMVLDGHRIVGRPSWLPATWRHVDDAAAVLHLCPDVAERDVFLCGSGGWMRAAEAALRGAGVARGQIHIERFSY